MPASYSQIIRQIETLQRQAESARSKEVAGVIARIKEAIAFYTLTPNDLGFGKAIAPPRATKSRRARTIKFADGAGNTWGGRGPRPAWLNAALAAGKSLDDFAVGGSRLNGSKARPADKTKSSSKGRKVPAKYGDEKGNTWAGRGLQPRWFKAALADGKTAESLLL
ncbi:MAG: H-NS histone family protein [Pseudomonadota bacterium]|nr:H-NS histone family protein [Pseudomonadota bacterium]